MEFIGDNAKKLEEDTRHVNELNSEIEIMDSLTEDEDVVVYLTTDSLDEPIELSTDDLHALIDHRVEEINELEHEIKSLESED